MNKVRKLTSTLVSFLVFALIPVIAQAIGISAIQIHSRLNEPLRAQIDLDSINENQVGDVKVFVADKEMYEKSGLTIVNWLQTIHFSIQKNTKTNEYYIELTTKDPVKEPYVDLLIELVWPGGKMIKEYTLLFDPPKIALPDSQQLRTPKALKSTFLETQVASNTHIGASGQVAHMVKKRAQARVLAKAHARVVRPGTTYGPIVDETLWSISKRLTENTPYTIYQGVAAISSKNPQAFRNGNIHFLPEGISLDLPTTEEIGLLSKSQAQHFVESQNTSIVNKTLPTESTKSSHVMTSEMLPPVKNHKPLKLIAPAGEDNQTNQQFSSGSSNNQPTTNEGSPMSSRLSLIEEAIDTMKRANEEIAQKNQRLQSQNESLLHLLSAKEAEIHQLKQEFGVKVPPKIEGSNQENYAIARAHPLPTKKNELNLPALDNNVSNSEFKKQLASEGAAHPQATQPVKASQSLEKPTQSLSKDEKAKKSELKPEVKENNKQSNSGSYLLLVIILILSLIILLIAKFGQATLKQWFTHLKTKKVLFSKKRTDDAVETDASNTYTTQAQSKTGDIDQKMDYGIHFDLNKSLDALSKQEKRYTRQENVSLAASDLKEQEDTSQEYLRDLEEAEVYIAYERYTQAEHILQNIVAKYPYKWDVLLKLLEIYVLTEKYDEFEKWYQTLPKDLRDVSPAIWSKIELLQEKVSSEKGISITTSHVSSDLTKEAYLDLEPKALASDKKKITSLIPEDEDLTFSSTSIEAPINKEKPKPFIDLEKKYTLTLDEDIDLDAENTPSATGSIAESHFQGLNELLPEVTDKISQEEEKILKTEKLISKDAPLASSSRPSPLKVAKVAEVENDITSQLSLAKAYLEIGDKESARELLIESLQISTAPEEKASIQALLNAIDK